MARTIFWILISAYFFAVGVAFLVTASEARAEITTPSDIQLLIAEKTRQSGTGVILAVSHRGPQAAETAYLLAVQSSHNPEYAPLLIIPEQPLQKELAALKLTSEQLPALIFFTADAKEVGRFVSSGNPPAEFNAVHSSARFEGNTRLPQPSHTHFQSNR